MSADASSLKQLSAWKVMGGYVKKFSHQSSTTKTEMKFSVFLPPSLKPTSAYPLESTPSTPVAAIYWLSGLTCTDDNFIQKAGAFRAAAEANVAIICPDTSPRGANLEGEKDSWDFGEGAGFYVNATQAPWSSHYNMFDYVNKELPALIASMNLGIDSTRKSVFGHSMGGHGALISFLRQPGVFRSVSAFAPISNPINCPWGHKAFGGYLGEDKESWKEWDATELAKKYQGPKAVLLVEQGGADDFLAKGQLLPENLQSAVSARGDDTLKVEYNLREGYDHSYFFISTFVEEHIKFHAKHLNQQ